MTSPLHSRTLIALVVAAMTTLLARGADAQVVTELQENFDSFNVEPFSGNAGWVSNTTGDGWSTVGSGGVYPLSDESTGTWGGSNEFIDNYLLYTPRTFGDSTTTVTISSSDDDSIGLVFRRVDANNFYVAFISREGAPNIGNGTPRLSVQEMRLYRVQGGNATQLGVAAVTYASNLTYRFRVVAVGSSLGVWFDDDRDGIFQAADRFINATDTAFSTGNVGFYCYDGGGLQGGVAACNFDDLLATRDNNPPSAVDDTVTVAEDSGATVVNVLANDTAAPDTGEILTVTAVTQPAVGGTVTLVGGVVRFTPAPNYSGPATFTYTISDGNGGFDTATVTVTVSPVNDPPSAVDDTVTVAEDSGATVVNVLANDTAAPDTGEILTVTAVTQPAVGGTVTLVGGVVRFTPAPNYSGPATFTYTISDGNGGFDTATVTVTVSPVDDQPVAMPDTATVAEDGEVTTAVLANDTGLGDGPVMVTVAVQPANGTVVVAPDGSITYTPDPDFTGVDTYSYTVTDADGDSATTTVTVTVTPVNDPPIAADDLASTDPGASVVIAVLANDMDIDGGPLMVTTTTMPSSGTVVINPDGTITYTAAAGFVGVDTFTYTISDGNGGFDTATVTVTVGADRDGDGLTDLQEVVRGTDADDPDSDDDGLEDGAEVFVTGTDPLDDDSDDDGLLDGTEDSDGDGVIDPGETSATSNDSDGDGLQDGTELGLTSPQGTDTDLGAFVPDGDPATMTDPANPDSDGDGVTDGDEDRDHDGVRDSGEIDPNDADSDDDGARDGAEPGYDTDTDGDGTINGLDPDSDNDGINDGTELGVTSPDADTDTSRGNFIPDADPLTTTDPRDPDTDDGGVPDGVEDADHDGQIDTGETDPNDPSDDRPDDDRDDDGIPDLVDNCPDIPNPLQEDGDGDGRGTACDPDDNGDGFNDDLGLSGGGCSSSHGGGAGLALLLLALVLSLGRRATGSVVVSLCVLGAAGTADAQEIDEAQDYPVERLRLAMDRDGVFDVEWAGVAGHLDWDVGLWLGHADDPLVIYRADEESRVGALVAQRSGAALTGSLALWDRLALGVEVPLVLRQDRPTTIDGNTMQLGSLSGFGLGDLRFAAKIALLRSRSAGVDVAVIPALTVPSSSSANYFGEAGVTFAPELAVSRAFGAIRLATNLGYRARDTSQVLNLKVDDEIFARIGAGYRFGERGGPPLELDLTLGGSTAAADAFGAFNRTAVELLGAATYDLRGPTLVFAGAGLGLQEGFGTPDWRVVVGVRIAPRDQDDDDDGIADTADACARDPEDVDAFEDRDGCPDPDNDGDGVLDLTDGAPLDPEDRDGFVDEDGIPDPDNDRDGIVDGDDRCAAEPETRNGFQDEDGCPDTADSDGDGVADDSDGCATEAEDPDGFADDDGCPDPDNDSDGVLDTGDGCPRDAGPALNRGCPDADGDGDGVVDRLDNCPTEAGKPGFQGCAEKQLVVITATGLDILDVVYFDTSKATIQARSYALLDNVAAVMAAHAEIPRFRVEGHTDNRGSDESNRDLSQRRAEAVVSYLAAKGVAGERLAAIGEGEARPIADNRSAKGRAANRRVEFRIVGDGSGIERQHSGPEGKIVD